MLTLVAGCGEREQTTSSAGHHHESPHGGTALELGNHEAHLDVVLDPAAGKVTAYVMDAHAENFVRIPSESFEISAKLPAGETTLVLKAVANAASGEKVGDTSQFEAQSDALKGVVGFDAELKQLVVRGKTYSKIPFHVGKAGADKKP
jgi:hypothetical protein